jgi:hypothetical protein
MADIFASFISKLVGLGFFNFLTFLLALALIYALLKQRKIFGENPVVNGIIALSIAFFIFAYPVITGISLTTQITTFLSQSFVFLLVFFIAFLIASLFYPTLPKMLEEFFKSRSTLFAMIGLAIALFVTSGLVGVIYSLISPTGAGGVGAPSGTPQTPSAPSPPAEVVLLLTGLIIAVVILLIAGSIRGGA